MSEERAEELLGTCLENMGEDALVDLHNEWCEQNRYYEDKIYPMFELDDYIGDLSQYTLGDLFGRFQMDDFNFDHDYFRDTIYGIESTDSPEYYWIDKNELVRYILRHEDCLGNKDVEEILLDMDDEDEEGAEE